MFARFLRIDFKTHYGNEYYCPLSLLRVHGKTMMDDFEESKGEQKSDSTSKQHAVILYTNNNKFMEEICPVTISQPKISQEEPTSSQSKDDHPPQQENIFKAIHQRLDEVERSQASCTRKIDLGMRRIEAKLLDWWIQRKGDEEDDRRKRSSTAKDEKFPEDIYGNDQFWSQRSFGLKIQAYLLKGLLLRTEALERFALLTSRRMIWLERIILAVSVLGLFQGVLLLRSIRRKNVAVETLDNFKSFSSVSPPSCHSDQVSENEDFDCDCDVATVPLLLLDGQPPIFDDPEAEARIEARYPDSPVNPRIFPIKPTNAG